MAELILVSFIWAFSFGLIKDALAGVDPSFVAAARLLISALVFLPFLRPRRIPRGLGWRLALVGALQFGAMYVTYIAAFRYLKAYEVALFTIFTPIYVTLIHDAARRRFNALNLATAALAVIGTGIVAGVGPGSGGILRGFALVQVSNLCFAYGQVRYKALMQAAPDVRDQDVFGVLYAGAFAFSGLAVLATTDLGALRLDGRQTLALVYLGAVASGLGFFLWNRGARKARIGALAIFNDLKVPLAVAVSLVFFGEQADVLRLATGGLIVIMALLWNESRARHAAVVQPRPESKAAA